MQNAVQNAYTDLQQAAVAAVGNATPNANAINEYAAVLASLPPECSDNLLELQAQWAENDACMLPSAAANAALQALSGCSQLTDEQTQAVRAIMRLVPSALQGGPGEGFLGGAEQQQRCATQGALAYIAAAIQGLLPARAPRARGQTQFQGKSQARPAVDGRAAFGAAIHFLHTPSPPVPLAKGQYKVVYIGTVGPGTVSAQVFEVPRWKSTVKLVVWPYQGDELSSKPAPKHCELSRIGTVRDLTWMLKITDCHRALSTGLSDFTKETNEWVALLSGSAGDKEPMCNLHLFMTSVVQPMMKDAVRDDDLIVQLLMKPSGYNSLNKYVMYAVVRAVS